MEMPGWTSIAVNIDHCEFYSNGDAEEERNTISPSAGLALYLKGFITPQSASRAQFVLKDIIDGAECRFTSPVLSLDMDSLRMRLVFGNCRLHYCMNDPKSYYFEL